MQDNQENDISIEINKTKDEKSNIEKETVKI